MIYLNEVENMKIMRRRGRLPINQNNKIKGSAIILVTPLIESSINMINSNLIRNMYHNGYYIERAIMYYVNNENRVLGSYNDEILLEGSKINFISENAFVNEYSDGFIDNSIRSKSNETYTKTSHGIYINNNGRIDMLLFDDFDNDSEIGLLNEGSFDHSEILRKIFYRERIRRRSNIYKIHDAIKAGCPQITKTALSYKRFRERNIFTDFYYYNEIFFKNNYYKLDRALYLYLDILGRYLSDKRLDKAGYNLKTIFIPVEDWVNFTGVKDNIYRYRETINPISVIYELLRKGDKELQKRWGSADIVLFGKDNYFKMDLNEMGSRDASNFLVLLRRLLSNIEINTEIYNSISYDNRPSSKKFELSPTRHSMEKDLDEKEKHQEAIEKLENIDDDKQSKLSIIDDIIGMIERGTRVKIYGLTGKSGTETMDKIVKKVEDAAETSYSTEEAMESLNYDDELKELIKQLKYESESNNQLSRARIRRNRELKEKSLDIKVDNRTVKEILEDSEKEFEMEEMKLNIDTINEDWKSLKFPKFGEEYNVEDDIINIMMDLSSENKKYPIGIRDIEVEDTSDPENWKKTYIFHLEDSNGKRNQLKLDIPDFVDGKYLMLGGSKKSITGQLMLLPVVKTDIDTVQVVTNYNKLFLVRFGSRKFVISDRISKFIDKIEKYKSIKVISGNSTRSNSRYSLPIDYMELAERYNKIETKDYIFYFDQAEIHQKYRKEIQKSKDKFLVGYNKKNNNIIYCEYSHIYSILLRELLISQHKDFQKIYDETKESTSYSYTRVKILGNNIPLIILLGYVEGLTTVMDKAGIKYTLHRKRPYRDPDKQGLIRFKDTYVLYDIDYESSLLLNGLTMCPTGDYNFIEVAKKPMYLDFLDLFGGRILADGIDNFYELLIDPITREVLVDKNMPTDFVELLLHANMLLADTSFSRHTNMGNMRYRSNEIVAACTYKVISRSYGEYKTELKRGRNAKMTAKQSAVIDEILSLNNVNESSELTPFLEAEEITAVSTKGPSGLNTERAYGLDKRAYEETMINVLAQSTPQGKSIGVNRQMTIDPNIKGKRGYIKPGSVNDDMSVAKSMNVSEAITSFGITRDDPPRTSMNLSQSKHTMRVKHADPLLISNGVDEAMPYMLSNTFSYKAKDNGKVIEKTNDYMIVRYNNGSTEYINLKPEIKKNSNSGFYVPVELVTDKRKGNRVKKNEIIAYDPVSYTHGSGPSSNIAAMPGTFSKIAILQVDEGFEDSVVISERMAQKMTSEIIERVDVIVEKNSNVYNVVRKGQKIREGDPLMIFQNASGEEDVGILLRSLTSDEEEISMLGRVPIKSQYTGIIEDVRTYRTVNKNELSPSLRREVNRTENELKEMREILEEYGVENINRYIDKPGKKDPIGRFKNVRDVVKFEFYIRYNDKMAIGDKLTFFASLKGIVSGLFPEGKEPYTDFRKDEPIDALLALGSVNARMVTSVKFNMLINKIIIELGRQAKDILGIKYSLKD